MQLTGTSQIGINTLATSTNGANFHGRNAQSGESLQPQFFGASQSEIERAATLAQDAFAILKAYSGSEKAKFLRLVAEKLDDAKAEIVERAQSETALPEARLVGEMGRTCGQLRLFADVVEAAMWVDARIDSGDPRRQPLPKPDVRSMLRALGPVVVFGASNFPLAFSVAGGDTAAAFAAGCPVIAKAHSAHPGTSEMVGQLICRAACELNWPEGTFSLLFDANHEVGLSLVRHPAIKAVGFTGSRRGGLALMQAAAAREVPIPVFAEMSSINPIVISSGALQARSENIATGLQGAVTQGVGQFCTNPGLVFVPTGAAGNAFIADLTAKMTQTAPATMLTSGICQAYGDSVAKLQKIAGVKTHLAPNHCTQTASAALFEISASTMQATPDVMDEVFGPSTLLVRYESSDELLQGARLLEGQLTLTLHLEEQELQSHRELIEILEEKAGRLVLNGFPTGVEVGHAMVHGGPFPATGDGQSTSVGSRAILRFARPICFQNWPDSALPPELQNSNPLGISRLLNGKTTTEAVD